MGCYETAKLQEYIMQYCNAKITIFNFVSCTVVADFEVF